MLALLVVLSTDTSYCCRLSLYLYTLFYLGLSKSFSVSLHRLQFGITGHSVGKPFYVLHIKFSTDNMKISDFISSGHSCSLSQTSHFCTSSILLILANNILAWMSKTDLYMSSCLDEFNQSCINLLADKKKVIFISSCLYQYN